VPQDRLRKLTDDNRELAANLKRDLVQPQPTRTSTKPGSSSRRGKGQGSDLGSGRGSEERHSSVPAGGRGTKRGKDNDVEKVGSLLFIYSLCFHLMILPRTLLQGSLHRHYQRQ
jgi:mortality factor 4-like protein 1